MDDLKLIIEAFVFGGTLACVVIMMALIIYFIASLCINWVIR